MLNRDVPRSHPRLSWGQKMKKKTITLISGNEDDWHWDVTLHIGKNGSIYNEGYIAIHAHKQYYVKNQKIIQKRSKDWNKNNKKRKAENGYKWYKNNKIITINRSIKWNRINRGKKSKIDLKYMQGRGRKRRKELGFIPLNKPFPNAAGHHVDSQHVIFIPNSVHLSIGHNLKTGKGMAKINAIAFRFLFKGEG